jgi:transposase InsO family protein
MCETLGFCRQTYYWLKKHPKPVSRRADDSEIGDTIERIYVENHRVYGARKIKAVLVRQGVEISLRRIWRIMKERGLQSAYTKKKYKAHKSKVNEANLPNRIERDFKGRRPLDVVTSDLTYVKVAGKWAYTCLLLDLYNREIIGHAASLHKDADLVKAAFASVDGDLSDIGIFHTDRGSEFDNIAIDSLLDAFDIKRSLSRKGNPYDNAVSETTFKLYKTEFAYRNTFNNLKDLQYGLNKYVWWFNHKRLHSTLGYMSPQEFKEAGCIIT